MASSDEEDVAVALQPLGDRARKRLRLAAAFLRKRGLSFPKQGNFYSQVLAALDEQPDRDALRELVDWVEAYDQVEGQGQRKA